MALKARSAAAAAAWALAVGGCGSAAAAAGAAEAATCEARNGAGAAACAARDSALLQTSRSIGARSAWPWTRKPKSITSDCATRLNRTEGNAACIVVKDNKALLVWVPYGGAPGWDLPGGFRKDNEASCETAEREVCEETGFQVRATKMLTNMVYECEVVSEHACKNPVDEGFLSKYWAAVFELDGLQYRGNTWGDKVGLLRTVLSEVRDVQPAQPRFRWPWHIGGLVQSGAEVSDAAGVVARRARAADATSDCAARLKMFSEYNAGCVVVHDGKGLLVWVPYGSSPGWDLPGGWKHSGEAGCMTAERETCEESGFKVRALKPLSSNIFLCEVVEWDACKNPVDEGFLQRKWVSVQELDGLQYRAYTWGDKVDLLRRALVDSTTTTPSPAQEPESQETSKEPEPQETSTAPAQETSNEPAQEPQEKSGGGSEGESGGENGTKGEGEDGDEHKQPETEEGEPGPKPPLPPAPAPRPATSAPAPVSTSAPAPVTTQSTPSPTPAGEEAAEPAENETTPAPEATTTAASASTTKSVIKDACGCEMCAQAGFSTTSNKCEVGKESSSDEVCACLRKNNANNMVDACGCDACNGFGWSTIWKRCVRGATTQAWEGCVCQNQGRWPTLVQKVA